MEIIFDKKILQSAKKGDREAFERIVFSLEKYVFYYLLKMVGHRETAEDLTQETFLKVYKNLKNIDVEGNVKAWVFKIAANSARDWFRQRNRRPELVWDVEENGEIPMETLSPESAYTYIDGIFMAEEIQATLGDLKLIHREVLLLYYYENQKYEEIAGILEIPLDTVKTRIRRAKESLKKVLDSKPSFHYEN